MSRDRALQLLAVGLPEVAMTAIFLRRLRGAVATA
jgi:hypothetical protein